MLEGATVLVQVGHGCTWTRPLSGYPMVTLCIQSSRERGPVVGLAPPPGHGSRSASWDKHRFGTVVVSRAQTYPATPR